MARSKKEKNSVALDGWHISMRKLLIAGSVALNIGFLVVGIAFMTTNVMDGAFIKEGLERYCAVNNDGKFKGSTQEVLAVRDFTCARGDAAQYFEDGLTKYMDDYRIPHATSPSDQ